MLKAIELENFKAFGERNRIEFAPITLIFGENSAGKSSILQAVSLLKQTRESRDKGALLLPRTERLAGTPVYTRQFEAIFGELTIDRVGQALASFERVIVTQPSSFDFYEQLLPFTRMDEDDIADDEELAAKYAEAKAAAEAHPMSELAIRGRDLFFGKANCSACHVGANLADEKYHNLGVGMAVDAPDLGRFAITKDEKDTGAFKTPTVRNVTLSPPYMHDGSLATLEEVVAWYDKGGHPNPSLSDKIKPLNLTEQERADLVEFMKACTSDTPPVETDRLPMAANP